MADEEIATRAPESDVERKSTENAEQSVFPGDTRAQEGASMGVRWSAKQVESYPADTLIGALRNG
jgi:hypothetical protein